MTEATFSLSDFEVTHEDPIGDMKLTCLVCASEVCSVEVGDTLVDLVLAAMAHLRHYYN